MVRRPTGGRALLHHREITYSVTAPVSTRDSLRESYARINRLLVDGLTRLGVAVEVATPRERALPPSAAPCFERPAAGELVVNGRKLVGSAQWRDEGAMLQHGSILVEDDQPLVSALADDGRVTAACGDTDRVARTHADDERGRDRACSMPFVRSSVPPLATWAWMPRSIKPRRDCTNVTSTTTGRGDAETLAAEHFSSRPHGARTCANRSTSADQLSSWLCTLCASPRRDSRATKSDDAGATADRIVIAAQNEPRTFMPPLLSQIDEKIIADQIFEPLAIMGDAGDLERDYRPALAESWSWEKDSTGDRFHLNPAARWHDGAPVRASDVRFTFDLYADSVVGYKDSELAGAHRLGHGA